MEASHVSKSSRQRGFTIVELLTSITILSVLVVMLAGVFSQVSRAWLAGEGNIERRRSARALTDYIGAELRSAALPAEITPTPGKGNLQFVINPPSSQVPDELRNADTVFWTAPLATESSYGEIAEIGYFVRWVQPDENAQRRGILVPRPALCRFFVNPSVEITSEANTHQDAAPAPRTIIQNPKFLIYDPTDPNSWLTPSLLDLLAPARAPTYAGLFGENVVGLWVEAFGLDGSELDRTFYSLPKTINDQKVGYLYQRPYLDISGRQRTREERAYLPAKVRVSIVQLDSHHVERLDPIGEQVRGMTRDGSIRNAETFLESLRSESQNSPGLATLLPGLRTYTTEVQLENAR